MNHIHFTQVIKYIENTLRETERKEFEVELSNNTELQELYKFALKDLDNNYNVAFKPNESNEQSDTVEFKNIISYKVPEYNLKRERTFPFIPILIPILSFTILALIYLRYDDKKTFEAKYAEITDKTDTLNNKLKGFEIEKNTYIAQITKYEELLNSKISPKTIVQYLGDDKIQQLLFTIIENGMMIGNAGVTRSSVEDNGSLISPKYFLTMNSSQYVPIRVKDTTLHEYEFYILNTNKEIVIKTELQKTNNIYEGKAPLTNLKPDMYQWVLSRNNQEIEYGIIRIE